jgi:hypothetical protein
MLDRAEAALMMDVYLLIDVKSSLVDQYRQSNLALS